MAWRIEEFVARGEIDNRTRGRVTGRLWFAGRAAPVEFDLAGNAWRDLAGRRLEFVNPEPKPGLPAVFAARQAGAMGDCTASRKVKVPDIPFDQIGEYYAARKPWPWHWGNSLYFEWFSAANGRVVIESAAYRLTISPEGAWDMSPAEEEAQRRANAGALTAFTERLGDAVARSPEPEGADEPAAASDEDRPQTEAEAERMQAESDRLVDRIQARMEREGPDADYEKILEEELERRRQERGEPPPTPEEEAERDARIEEMNRAMAEEETGDEPWSEDEADHKHPLAERAFEFSVRLHREIDRGGWLPAGASQEHPVAELVAMTLGGSAKLAGALNGRVGLPPVRECAGCIVRLKRARGCFDDALLAAETCAEQKLADGAWLAAARRELTEIAEATDGIIGELRARLKRGWD
jgi:hypothetical protein